MNRVEWQLNLQQESSTNYSLVIITVTKKVDQYNKKIKAEGGIFVN